MLREEVAAGGSMREAAEAVLDAAGHRAAPRRGWPAGLTDREVEVLRALARGASNKAIAQALGLSPKTVGHHVAHVYTKARRVHPRRGDAVRDGARPAARLRRWANAR